MDHPYNHYRKHKPENDLQRYNKLKNHTSQGMDLYNVRWCMLCLPNIPNVVCTLVDSLVHVQCNWANMSIQLSNQPHGIVSMGRMDLVYISAFQAQCKEAVLRGFCLCVFMFKFHAFEVGNIYLFFVQKKSVERKKKKGKT